MEQGPTEGGRDLTPGYSGEFLQALTRVQHAGYNGKTLAESNSAALQPQYSGSRRLLDSVPNNRYAWSFGLIFAVSMLGCLGLLNIRQRKQSIPEFLDV